MKKILFLSVSLLLAAITTMASSLVTEPANITVGGFNATGADARMVPKSATGANIDDVQPAVAYDAGPVNVYIKAFKGFVRENTNSFEGQSVQNVKYYYEHGILESNVLTHQLLPEDITQPLAQNKETVWFLVHVVSMSKNTKFLPSKLSFSGGSSDGNNYLATTASLSSDSSFTYSPRFYGIIWANGGPRVSDTILSTPGAGKISEVPVNECIFIGAQLNYFKTDTGYGPWIMGFADYSVNGTWTYNDGTNSAHASKTLHTKAPVSLPWISLDVKNNSAIIGANMETNSTAILYSTPQFPVVWKKEGVINSGDTYTFPENAIQYYFRLVPM